MNKTKRIEELIEQAKREQEEPMAKKIHRIEVLEQRVAELMGQVGLLKAQLAQVQDVNRAVMREDIRVMSGDCTGVAPPNRYIIIA